jgi:NAD(P)-dependent dehydrogenase (short-subunit alcohol dehydrogenase family)
MRIRDLTGRVAVVTGASRGAGRGIAGVLGECGATVYVTGRSSRGGTATDGLPGTVEDTADEVTRRGGQGVALRCDHTVDAEVEAVFGRVQAEQGRLDLLVNNVWNGYSTEEPRGLDMAPFWKLPLKHWDRMFVAGVRAHLVASRLGAPLMLPQESGLIVNTVAWLHGQYLRHIYYDLSKACIVRMAADMAEDLSKHRVAAVALAPGFMRTERVMAAHAAHPFDLGRTESPEYMGRAVACLAADAAIMDKTGSMLYVGDLAEEYDFTDVDGRRVPVFRV